MYRLTERRLGRAKAVLEEYRERLRSVGRVNGGSLETKLRQVWRIGYQELKDIVIDMLKQPKYRDLALYYMEHVYATGPPSEFKPYLRRYGRLGANNV